jgi:3-hydroxyacyl-CoA dehydrogenase
MLGQAAAKAEESFRALVFYNQGEHFCVGANLFLVAMAAGNKDWDAIRQMVKAYQDGTQRLKYARVPVVAAPHGLALGGGCETCLHADAINALAETYMGLVEIGVGLLPAGGGTKELALRAIRVAERHEADVTPFIAKAFTTIAMAKVSTSGAELEPLGFLRHGDAITLGADRLQKLVVRNCRGDRTGFYWTAPWLADTIPEIIWSGNRGD